MAVSDNEIVVRDQKVAGSNPVTSMEAPVNDSDVGLQELFCAHIFVGV